MQRKMGNAHVWCGLIVLLAVANVTVGLYPSQVTVSLLDTRSNCSGVVASPNMIITSAQCVHHIPANRIKVLTAYERYAFNVSRVHIHNLFDVNNLSSDVAILQLNGSTVAPSADIDWNQSHASRCQLDARYGKFIPPRREPFTSPVDLTNCTAIYNHQLTSCLNYTLNDISRCNHNYNELATDRGTPVVCGGSCIGILSAVAQSHTPQCNASAYITRFNAVNGQFCQRIINSNRPVSAGPVPVYPGGHPQQNSGVHPQQNSGVQHNAHPHQNVGVPYDTQHQHPHQQHNHQATPTQHVPYANRTTKKNGRSGIIAWTPNYGVVFGLATFAVFMWV